MNTTRIPAIDRLLRRCEENESGCWIFAGAKRYGYGAVGLPDGRTALAHRVTFEHFIGEIPAGLDLDHLCRTRACCNPWHVEPVTRRVNANRGLRGKGYRDEVCPNGHAYTAATTRTSYRGGRQCLVCAQASQLRKNAARRTSA